MNQKIKILLTLATLVMMLFLAPSFLLVSLPQAHAQSDSSKPGDSGYQLLVKCSGGSQIAGSGGESECTWKDLIAQINKIINFLFYISVILATIAFIYCGYLFLTAGGDTGKAGDAKKVLYKVVIGFIWIFAAWLIVHFITTSLGLNSDISIIENSQ